MSDWEIFKGKPHEPHAAGERLQRNVPPWRNFQDGGQYRGRTYLPSPAEVRVVNAALHLRRPVLVTGQPGSGKSSLAYAVAEELQLGQVLKWPINSRSTLAEGLYHYDAIARLRDVNLEKSPPAPGGAAAPRSQDISQYLQLQWLGTALASSTPRVLLIDEIDKADIDLPNDLLHVLEEGTFSIPELLRISSDHEKYLLRGCEPDSAERFVVTKGVVRCTAFPIIILTSNGERELPLAFHRRCLRLDIAPPNPERLRQIVEAHLSHILASHDGASDVVGTLIGDFDALRQQNKVVATDQLLNLIFLLFGGEARPVATEEEALQKLVFRALDE